MSDTPDTTYPVISASDVAERLTALSASYNAENPQPDNLSPEAASARLAEMTRLYREQTKPRHSEADAAVVSEPARPAEYIETTSWPAVSVRNKLSTIEDLRNIGIPAEGLANILAGKEYKQADVNMAKAWKHRAEHDPELRALILSGDPDARHVLTAMSAILAAGAKVET